MNASIWWLSAAGVAFFLPPLFIGNSIIILFAWAVLAAKQGNDDTRRRERETWK